MHLPVVNAGNYLSDRLLIVPETSEVTTGAAH